MHTQGGSWDDNSVGHGSVAARMRRDRNRAITRRTQSNCFPYTTNTDIPGTVDIT